MSGSSINVFIAEVIRAANQIEKVGDLERSRLLDRAVRIVREMRIQSGIRAVGPGRDILADVAAASRAAAVYSDEEIRAHLLDAAGMMRDLHVVLDSGTSISIGAST